ncbi:MAG: arylesterase [Brachymonas sp.]|jgi:acyl-CoA thioesterase-1|nr:arylesterase [Brachymonas sp.]MBP6138821.1 arylesterase [Brachymonas sp.]MBP6966950.1 arylesterase [Brachymonas sp.]MBP7247390.1 arylesterase [Brachymonas sp.]MBP7740090.1 arylesterase [Brachymonas sp.]
MPNLKPAPTLIRKISGALLLALAFALAPTHAAAQALPRKILVLGDSISAEYGMARGAGWVALLQKKLTAEKRPWQVINASISGDTTAGGRARLAQQLAQHQPQVLIVELGGNDALRGLPLLQTQANLAAMTEMAQKAGARVLLLGMQVPPNYGADYSRAFAQTFADVAKAKKTALVPFLLKGVGDVPESQKWFQSDRIHPNAQAQPLLLANVWPQLVRLLR